MSRLALIVNGVAYAGWLSASVTLSLESIAGTFALEISPETKTPSGEIKTNPAFAPFQKQLPIGAEDECTIQLDDDIVLTGSVDRVRRRLTATDHIVSIEGRDRAAVLVDCTPNVTQRQFNGIGILEFCQRLADPFGVTVLLQDGVSDAAISTTPAPSGSTKKEPAKRPSAVGSAGKSTTATKVGNPKATLTIDPGDTAFSLIDRACRLVGILPVSDGLGNVVLTRSSSIRCTTAIVEGQNLLEAEVVLDATRRYARYIVSGQDQPAPNGEDDGSDYDASLFSDVSSTPDHGKDAGVVRSERLLIVRAEGAITPALANARADWEAAVRAARGTQLDLGVQGWRQGDGRLWPLNALVPVRSPSCLVDDELLIASLTFSQSAQEGTRTKLSVTRADAFMPEPIVAGGKSLQPWWGVKGGLR